MHNNWKSTLALLMVAATIAGAQVPTSKEDRQQILKFGIETDLLDLVRTLQQEQNKDFIPELAATCRATQNTELKELILGYFLDLKDKSLESDAVEELRHPEKKANSLLLTTVSYLTGIKAASSEEVFVGLMNNKNKTLALASIRALAKIEAKGKVAAILAVYNDAETEPNFKPDIIWALGELKAREAVETLLKEYNDSENAPLLRGSILSALGKIGDNRAWDLVFNALSSDNSDLRAAAVATLASFPGHKELNSALTKALRDAQVNVRLAGAEAAGALKASELTELLMFRVKKDPEPKIRVASVRAISQFPEGDSPVLVLLADRKTDFSVWKESLNQALAKKWSGTLASLKKVLEDENKAKSSVLAPIIAASLIAQKEIYRVLFGLLLQNDAPSSRGTALRAISIGNFREYEPLVRSISLKDSDSGVKTQALGLLKAWGVSQ